MPDARSKCEKDIDVLIRSRYPLIYVVSYEEARVFRSINEMARERNKQLFLWSVTCGIHKPQDLENPQEPMKVEEPTRDPISALNHIERQTYPAIFVLKDFHPYLTDNTVVRKLRDLVENLKQTYETIVILSPVLSVPVELEKDIAVVDFCLPDSRDMNKLLDDIVETISKSQEIKVNLSAETREKLINASLGLTLNEAENALARAIVADKSLGPEDIDKILAEKEQVIRKSGILEYYHTQEALGDVGGLDALKDWLTKRSVAFTEKAKQFGLPQPKGILLIGVQGCGKSLTAKAISGLWRLPLLRFDVGRVFSGIVGSSEENMRKAIRTAESVSPVILWIDEIEKSLSGVQSSTFSDAGTSARVFSTFLTWLQEKKDPVFVIATANNISLLPPELLRKGRFDEIFFVDLPRQDERKEIFSIHIKKRGRNPQDFDLDALTRQSEGFSGAEIEQAVIASLFDAFVDGKDINTDYLLKNLSDSVPLSRTMKEEIQSLRDWAATRARQASPAAKDAVRQRERKIEL